VKSIDFVHLPLNSPILSIKHQFVPIKRSKAGTKAAHIGLLPGTSCGGRQACAVNNEGGKLQRMNSNSTKKLRPLQTSTSTGRLDQYDARTIRQMG